MITTYAISLTADECTDTDRIRLVDLVSDWLVDEYPPEERPPGTFVRTREGADDPVFRVSISANTPSASHSTATDITVVMNTASLTFDIRSVTLPMSQRITKMSATPVPPNLVQLVQRVLRAIPVYDANRRVTADTEIIRDTLGGQSVGAMLVSAPGRNLPVLIEVRDYERNTPALFAKGAGPLSGLVHSYCLDSADAVRGFIDITGESLTSPGSIYVYWAGPRDVMTLSLREMPPASRVPEGKHLVQEVLKTAALSLAPPRVPPPPVDNYFDDEEIDEGETFEDGDELEVAYESAVRRISELEGAVASADRMIAEQRSQLEQKGQVVDELVLRNVTLETMAGSMAGSMASGTAVATMKEALRIAQEKCTCLYFHPRAIESGEELEGPEPIAVLQDLARLNDVARAWMSGDLNRTSFQLACRNVGLDYAPTISDTARQKYEEDYLITLDGRTVRAEAHLRRGRKMHLFRIHIYLDDERQRVVVAYIGKHLRGKRDN